MMMTIVKATEDGQSDTSSPLSGYPSSDRSSRGGVMLTPLLTSARCDRQQAQAHPLITFDLRHVDKASTKHLRLFGKLTTLALTPMSAQKPLIIASLHSSIKIACQLKLLTRSPPTFDGECEMDREKRDHEAQQKPKFLPAPLALIYEVIYTPVNDTSLLSGHEHVTWLGGSLTCHKKFVNITANRVMITTVACELPSRRTETKLRFELRSETSVRLVQAKHSSH
ncbi:hypothetical protein RRG08_061277 [Elysia crispata]|uniref:Uncharacterized protein n=1 Tax=Elysia crispata TaxID=231223 RepID=A0AAE0ZGL6_9GAST|nr:hypothetical protein RRG08_061277 [Elysia crispata]